MSADPSVAAPRRRIRLLAAGASVFLLASGGALYTILGRNSGSRTGTVKAAAPASITVEATDSYLNGPGSSVLALHQTASVWLSHPDIQTCHEMAQRLGALGGAFHVDTVVGDAPDPVLVDFATDELALIADTTQSCATPILSLERSQLTKVDAAVTARLAQLGIRSGQDR